MLPTSGYRSASSMLKVLGHAVISNALRTPSKTSRVQTSLTRLGRGQIFAFDSQLLLVAEAQQTQFETRVGLPSSCTPTKVTWTGFSSASLSSQFETELNFHLSSTPRKECPSQTYLTHPRSGNSSTPTRKRIMLC